MLLTETFGDFDGVQADAPGYDEAENVADEAAGTTVDVGADKAAEKVADEATGITVDVGADKAKENVTDVAEGTADIIVDNIGGGNIVVGVEADEEIDAGNIAGRWLDLGARLRSIGSESEAETASRTLFGGGGREPSFVSSTDTTDLIPDIIIYY